MRHLGWAVALALVAVAEMPAQQALPDAPSFALGFQSDLPPAPPPSEPLATPRLDPPETYTGVMAVRASPCAPASPRLPDSGNSAAPPQSSGASPQLKPCPQNQIRPFINGDKRVTPLSPAQKAHLAFHDISDPFNLLTIAGNSTYTIATNAHTAFGPGLRGFGRLSGYTLAQDATGETLGTFVMPAIFHQDPRYFRMPHANPARRLLHAVDRVIIAQGDDGRPMPNYANLFTSPICNELSNLYVPGLATNSRATTDRILTGFLTEPIGTIIAEFLPDVASHIHVRIVLVQRYINQISGMPNNQSVQNFPTPLASF